MQNEFNQILILWKRKRRKAFDKLSKHYLLCILFNGKEVDAQSTGILIARLAGREKDRPTPIDAKLDTPSFMKMV
jgi:hypothetical protein